MTAEIEITKAGEEPGAASFKVAVAPGRVERAEHNAAKALAKRARLPGFRKGKAPLAVIRKRYHDAIREQVLREVIGETWETAVERENLKPIADPRVREVKFETGASLTFELHVEVRPELTLERLSGFTVARAVPSVTDEMVAAQLEEVRRQRAPWVPVAGRFPRAGDMVRGSLATIEDSAVGEPREFQIVLGEGQAIPDVEEKLMTLTPGNRVEVDVRFPEDFPDAAKRGQSRRVQLTLDEAKVQDLPALDDEFAREVGDFEALDDLRNAVRADLESDARREAEANVRRSLLEQIVAANNVPAPRPLVHRVLEVFRQTYGVPDDRAEAFITEFRPIAEHQVRRDLVLDHVVTQQQLRATEEELDERIGAIARRRKVEPGQVYSELQKANRLKELEQSIAEEKAFRFLLEQSTITES